MGSFGTTMGPTDWEGCCIDRLSPADETGKVNLSDGICSCRAFQLIGTLLSRANAENVGDGPGRRIRVVFAERGFVAAELLKFKATGVHIELGLGTALQMLRGHDADASGQHLVVQVMHRKRRARENKKHATSVVFTESGLTPHPVLLAPLIGTWVLDEPEILYGGIIVLEDGL